MSDGITVPWNATPEQLAFIESLIAQYRASLTTAEKAKAKLEREIQLVTAEHDKAWVLLGKENDKARALAEKNTRLKEQVEMTEALYADSEVARLVERNAALTNENTPLKEALRSAVDALRLLAGEVLWLAAGSACPECGAQPWMNANCRLCVRMLAAEQLLSGRVPAVTGTTSDNTSVSGQPEGGGK